MGVQFFWPQYYTVRKFISDFLKVVFVNFPSCKRQKYYLFNVFSFSFHPYLPQSFYLWSFPTTQYNLLENICYFLSQMSSLVCFEILTFKLSLILIKERNLACLKIFQNTLARIQFCNSETNSISEFFYLHSVNTEFDFCIFWAFAKKILIFYQIIENI